MLWLEGGAREGAQEGQQSPWWRRMFGGEEDHARAYRAKRLGAAERHQGAPPRHLRGGMGKSLHGSAGGWAGPRFYPLQSGYGISAGRGRTGGSGGIPRARGSRPTLHHHAAWHGDAARSVTSASLSPAPDDPPALFLDKAVQVLECCKHLFTPSKHKTAPS